MTPTLLLHSFAGLRLTSSGGGTIQTYLSCGLLKSVTELLNELKSFRAKDTRGLHSCWALEQRCGREPGGDTWISSPSLLAWLLAHAASLAAHETYEGANVSLQVVSHTKNLPLLQGTREALSGLFPSER